MSKKPRRILLKFGSGILTRPRANALDDKQFRRLTADVAQLVRGGCKCIIVSSGAVAAGMRVVGLKERPPDLTTGQACAAVGQSKMMHLYASMFAKHQLNVAQLLLTHSDLDSRTRHQNAKNTLRRLLECKNVVPVINENDSVAVEELRFGDPDPPERSDFFRDAAGSAYARLAEELGRAAVAVTLAGATPAVVWKVRTAACVTGGMTTVGTAATNASSRLSPSTHRQSVPALNACDVWIAFVHWAA